MKLTEQQLEEYAADLEYDDLMAEGFRTVGQKTFAEHQEEKDRMYSLFKGHLKSNAVEE